MIDESINGDETKTLKVLNGHTRSLTRYPVSSSAAGKLFWGAGVVVL